MIEPHGGKLVDRIVSEKESTRIIESFSEYNVYEIGQELAQEINNIVHGIFSPLEGFLTGAEFTSVLEGGRLPNDIPWTIPIVYDINPEKLEGVSEGDTIGLTYKGNPLAVLELEDIYEYDSKQFAESVFRTTDSSHPGVEKINGMQKKLLGGKVRMIADMGNPYPDHTLYPKETRVLFKEKGWKTVVAFQTRNPPHLGHEYVQKTALSIVDGLFVNPLIGKKKVGDFTDEVILQSYNALMQSYYPDKHATMAVLHTEMRYGGPREAIHHAIMRKNYGCTHFIVGRDHAGVGDFYGPFDAQYIFDDYPDMGITPIFFRSFFFCKKCNSIANDKICPHGGDDHINFAGKKIRAMLADGEIPPVDMMREEVSKTILQFDEPFVK
ncbi:MAG: sulfate adenylyltransferase [Candidatus Thorarchaeota archaeon]